MDKTTCHGKPFSPLANPLSQGPAGRFLLLRHYGVEYKILRTGIYQAVGMPLGTVVAFAGMYRLLSAVDEYRAAAAYYEYCFATCIVRMQAYRGSRFEPSVQYLVVLVDIHFGIQSLFTAVEVFQNLLGHRFEIDDHINSVFQNCSLCKNSFFR